MKSDYDLVVIGSGNAGQAAADIARDAGWSALVVEARDVGGTCPLGGCVPKKVLVAAAEVLDSISRAPTHRIRARIGGYWQLFESGSLSPVIP